MTFKPSVDGLKEQFGKQVDIRVYECLSDFVAAELAERFGVTAFPSYVLVDAQSRAEVFRGRTSLPRLWAQLNVMVNGEP